MSLDTVQTAPATADGDVVTFLLAGEVLCVPTAHVREVLDPVPATRVPDAHDFADRLINVRGAVVPLADLRVPLRMPRTSDDAETRIIVLEISLGGEPTVVGIRADKVHEVTRIDSETLEAIPSVGTRWPPRYVSGVGRWNGRFVTIPDLAAIFADFLPGQSGQYPSVSGVADHPASPERK